MTSFAFDSHKGVTVSLNVGTFFLKQVPPEPTRTGPTGAYTNHYTTEPSTHRTEEEVELEVQRLRRSPRLPVILRIVVVLLLADNVLCLVQTRDETSVSGCYDHHAKESLGGRGGGGGGRLAFAGLTVWLQRPLLLLLTKASHCNYGPPCMGWPSTVTPGRWQRRRPQRSTAGGFMEA